MRKRVIALMMISSLLFVFISACSKDVEKFEDKTSILEKPEEFPIPEFPENPFQEIKEKPEKLPDPNTRHIAVRMFQFGFDPEVLEIEQGTNVYLTITSADVGHGFALPDFGINKKIPPEESVTVNFKADIIGEFEFFESVYSGKGWKDMKGKFIVIPSPSEQSE